MTSRFLDDATVGTIELGLRLTDDEIGRVEQLGAVAARPNPVPLLVQ